MSDSGRIIIPDKLHRAQMSIYRDKTRFRVVVAGRRFGKCLSKGTLVWMADGTQAPVELVRAGQLVLSLNPSTMRLEPRRVLATSSNGVREQIAVLTPGRSIQSTPHHPHLINGQFDRADSIRKGDLLGIAKRQAFGTHVVPAAELEALAIWLAEGRGQSISNGSSEVLDCFRAAMTHFDCEIVHRSKYDWGIRRLGAINNFTKYLRELDLFDRDSKTKFIPEFAFRLTQPLLARFLNLWFATDGCITRNGSIQIGLANERMVRQLSDLLAKFGIHGAIYHKVHKATGKDGKPFESWSWCSSAPESVLTFAREIGALGKEKAVETAVAVASASRGNANAYLPIAYEQFVAKLSYVKKETTKYGGYNAMHDRAMPDDLRLQLNNWRKQSSQRMSVKRYLDMRHWVNGYWDNLLNGDVTWEVVKRVESAPSAETFDLQIEGNSNFVANGVITHNTHLLRAELREQAARKRNANVWYVAPTYGMAREIMWDALKVAIPDEWIRKVNETLLKISLVNGSQITLKGADRPDTLRGVGLDFVGLDEYQDFRPFVWEQVLRPTLATTQGGALFIGTPKSFNHFHDLYKKGERQKTRKRPDWKSWQFPTITSPFVPTAEVEQAKRDLDPRTFRQEFMATFETMSGRVYYAFERRKNVGSFKFNPKLPIWVGQDFNINPMSCAILQPQPNGEVWIVDEIVLYNSNVSEVCDVLEQRYWRYMDQITIFPDPAGGSRQHARGESALDIFRERGFRRILNHKKHPFVQDRVNAVNSMLYSADGTIRLRVDEQCRNTIDGFEQVIYKSNSSEVDKSLNKEHILDGIGYCLEYNFPTRKIVVLGVNI